MPEGEIMRSSNGSFKLLALLLALSLSAAACGSDTATDAASEAVDEAVDSAVDGAIGDAMGDDVTVSFGLGFPEGWPIYQNVMIDWGDDVNAATDGTVTVEFFPGGALGPPPTEYERVQSGVNDLGLSLTSYTAGRFPLIEAIEMPFLFETAEQGTNALWDLWEEFPELQAEFDDTKILGLFTHDPGALWSSTGVKTSLDDVKGMSLRSAGPSVNRLIEALGATAVNMPVTELYDSMDRGVVDGTIIATSGTADFNLVELSDSGIMCNCYVLAFFITMNLDVWNSLSPAQQSAIESVSGRELSLKTAAVFEANRQRAMDQIAENGVELYVPDGDELARWEQASAVAIQQWIDSVEAEGAPGQEMYDFLVKTTGG